MEGSKAYPERPHPIYDTVTSEAAAISQKRIATAFKAYGRKKPMIRAAVNNGYDSVLAEAQDIQRAKVEQYGTERYEETDVTKALLLVYSDIYRKQLRLWELTKEAAEPSDNQAEAAAKLRSDLIDILNYAAMGVQMIDYLGLDERNEE